MNIELKPCPFCGGKAEMMGDQYPYVECQECGAGFTANHSYEFDEDDAASKWNARSTVGPNLKPIAESKVRQLGGDVCGVLVRNEAGAWAAVSEGGRVMWLDDFEGQPSSAQGGRGADAVKWSDPAVDPIVSKLYRKFKEWNRQGFGADDVTWCEVRGYVAELLNAQPQPAVPEGLPGVIKAIAEKLEKVEGESADGGYMWDARECAEFIREEADKLSTAPQADGWKVKFMQIMGEIYSDLDDEHEDPIPSDLWDLWRDLRAATQPPVGQEGDGDE